MSEINSHSALVAVPINPTNAMLEASAVEWTSLCCGYPPEPGHYKFMRSLWSAMLAAHTSDTEVQS